MHDRLLDEPSDTAKGLSRLRGRTKLAILAGVLVTFFLMPMTKPQESANPIFAALEAHRRTYGRYPEELSELIDGGLLPSMPAPGSDLGVVRGGFYYFYDKDFDQFILGYTETQWLHFHTYSKDYVSTKQKWMDHEADPLYDLTDPFTFALDNAGRGFREGGSSRHLELFVKKIIDFNRTYPRILILDHLDRALGSGEIVEVDRRLALRYSATDQIASTYYFVTDMSNEGPVSTTTLAFHPFTPNDLR